MSARLGPDYVKQGEWTSTGSEEVMVFYPTLMEMRDFSAYLEYCEKAGAHLKSGICKIVPPMEWSPRPTSGLSYDEVDDFIIKAPVKESVANASYNGAYVKENKVYRKEMTVRSFRELAQSIHYTNPRPDLELKDMERLCVGEPIYGADTPGSLYDSDVDEFCVPKLGTLLDLLKDVSRMQIPGVNTPYLYFGMFKTTFSWHTEDMDLYSINYLHYGDPKVSRLVLIHSLIQFWYAIPSDDAVKFERLCAQKFPEDANRCKAYLRHKTHIVTPKEIKAHGISMFEYSNRNCKGYHMGFNLGYNCAESTNFALDRWIDFGKKATVCKCIKGSVEIDMVPFMKKFRPEEFDSWYEYWYRPRIIVVKGKKEGKEGGAFVVPSVDLPSVGAARMSNFKLGMEEVRRTLHFLWQHQQDFKEEVNFNKRQGDLYPFCAVCQHFVPTHDQLEERPSSSERYSTEQLLSKSCVPFETEIPLSPSRLIQCKRCAVVVHEHCYMVDPAFFSDSESHASTSEVSESEQPHPKRRKTEKTGWLCKRCDFAREQLVCAAVNCVLCPLRGGALVPLVSGNKQPGQFVHIVCAIMHRRMKIVKNPAKLDIYAIKGTVEGFEDDPIKLREALSIPQDYMRYEPDLYLHVGAESDTQCGFCCQPFSNSFVKCQSCLDSGAESPIFHVPCAHLARLHLEHRHYPYLALAVCPLHVSDDSEVDKYPINIGDGAVFFGNRECDRVTVIGMDESTFYHVEFLDCSFSADVTLQDLVDCQCKHVGCNGEHLNGWLVTVRWENDQLFQGYFREKVVGTTFTVESLNSKQVRTCSRNALYRMDEPKPDEVEQELEKLPFII